MFRMQIVRSEFGRGPEVMIQDSYSELASNPLFMDTHVWCLVDPVWDRLLHWNCCHDQFTKLNTAAHIIDVRFGQMLHLSTTVFALLQMQYNSPYRAKQVENATQTTDPTSVAQRTEKPGSTHIIQSCNPAHSFILCIGLDKSTSTVIQCSA